MTSVSFLNTPAQIEAAKLHDQFGELFPTAFVTDVSQRGEWTQLNLTYTLDAPKFECAVHSSGHMLVVLTVGEAPHSWVIPIEMMENRWPELYMEAGLHP